MNSPTSKKPRPASRPSDHGRIVAEPSSCLDTLQLERLEREFRTWAEGTPRADVALSRRRILLIFLLIRHTGAKLHEVLTLNPVRDVDHDALTVVFGRDAQGGETRTVPLSETLSREITALLDDETFLHSAGQTLSVDPAFVRRKFYERAQACGFPKQLGSPEAIRKSRGVELMQSNMPLPAVQKYLGHSTPNLTSSYVSFSEDDIQAVTSTFLQRESARKTSARNAFFGRVGRILPADLQAVVELVTPGGHTLSSIITLDSLKRMGLKEGRLATIEVKAPWVHLYRSEAEPLCSAENRFLGSIVRLNRGRINTECVLRIDAVTELCAIGTNESLDRLGLREGATAWAVFGAYSTILRVD